MTTINPATSIMSPITKPITPKGGGGAIDFSSLITASANDVRGLKQPIKVGPGQFPSIPGRQTSLPARLPDLDIAETAQPVTVSPVKARGGVVSCPIDLA